LWPNSMAIRANVKTSIKDANDAAEKYHRIISREEFEYDYWDENPDVRRDSRVALILGQRFTNRADNLQGILHTASNESELKRCLLEKGLDYQYPSNYSAQKRKAQTANIQHSPASFRQSESSRRSSKRPPSSRPQLFPSLPGFRAEKNFDKGFLQDLDKMDIRLTREDYRHIDTAVQQFTPEKHGEFYDNTPGGLKKFSICSFCSKKLRPGQIFFWEAHPRLRLCSICAPDRAIANYEVYESYLDAKEDPEWDFTDPTHVESFFSTHAQFFSDRGKREQWIYEFNFPVPQHAPPPRETSPAIPSYKARSRPYRKGDSIKTIYQQREVEFKIIKVNRDGAIEVYDTTCGEFYELWAEDLWEGEMRAQRNMGSGSRPRSMDRRDPTKREMDRPSRPSPFQQKQQLPSPPVVQPRAFPGSGTRTRTRAGKTSQPPVRRSPHGQASEDRRQEDRENFSPKMERRREPQRHESHVDRRREERRRESHVDQRRDHQRPHSSSQEDRKRAMRVDRDSPFESERKAFPTARQSSPAHQQPSPKSERKAFPTARQSSPAHQQPSPKKERKAFPTAQPRRRQTPSPVKQEPLPKTLPKKIERTPERRPANPEPKAKTPEPKPVQRPSVKEEPPRKHSGSDDYFPSDDDDYDDESSDRSDDEPVINRMKKKAPDFVKKAEKKRKGNLLDDYKQKVEEVDPDDTPEIYKALQSKKMTAQLVKDVISMHVTVDPESSRSSVFKVNDIRRRVMQACGPVYFNEKQFYLILTSMCNDGDLEQKQDEFTEDKEYSMMWHPMSPDQAKKLLLEHRELEGKHAYQFFSHEKYFWWDLPSIARAWYEYAPKHLCGCFSHGIERILTRMKIKNYRDFDFENNAELEKYAKKHLRSKEPLKEHPWLVPLLAKARRANRIIDAMKNKLGDEAYMKRNRDFRYGIVTCVDTEEDNFDDKIQGVLYVRSFSAKNREETRVYSELVPKIPNLEEGHILKFRIREPTHKDMKKVVDEDGLIHQQDFVVLPGIRTKELDGKSTKLPAIQIPYAYPLENQCIMKGEKQVTARARRRGQRYGGGKGRPYEKDRGGNRDHRGGGKWDKQGGGKWDKQGGGKWDKQGGGKYDRHKKAKK